ncbi:unnamed protein product [Ranitomeya imitator]|uniref:PHD-type domain-containing protein n=1 Tax=Ranitomeya imitator TaxID=111125 RepID=A0ABN9L3S5_9NEOB|nr:unnamed protein product [Ranitomeya imitator]
MTPDDVRSRDTATSSQVVAAMHYWDREHREEREACRSRWKSCSVGAKASHAMEEVPSVTFETELNLEILESSSPASISDDKEHITEDVLRSVKPTSKEFKKTWGFRKTTIAKREIFSDTEMETADSTQQNTPSLRRSGRQPKRTERVEEFLTTVRRNRGRKSNNLEDSSDRSCPVTDAETASEGSVESTPDFKTRGVSAKTPDKKEEDDSSDDSDGMTLKELQNKLRSQRSDHPAGESVSVHTFSTANPNISECTVRTRSANRAALQQQTRTTPIKQEPLSPEHVQDQKWEKNVSPKSRPEAEIYDPNTLYCICRKPHNNRFMICCDRCEEWFHGDCVGISEGRGRLLEKEGEDYICPNCTVLQENEESGADGDNKQKTSEPVPCVSDITSVGTVDNFAPNQGIKGRIEKAAHPSGKKKLKIFHPVAVPESVTQPQAVSDTANVSHEVTMPAELSDSPEVAKCIGPGCVNNALPDSVYCSHDCILKHAAATIKSLSSSKESKPKEKIKVKLEKKPAPKTQTSPNLPVVQKSAVPEKMDSVMKKVLVIIPRMEGETSSGLKMESGGNAPSWESDHNYIAVKPEKTAAVSSTLFYKCMYHIGVPPHTANTLNTYASSLYMVSYGR